MIVKPHHLAAIQYTLIGMFVLATWYLLLAPAESTAGQLMLIFAEGYEKRTFFLVLAIVSITTLLLAIIFWFPRSASLPLATFLALTSICVFALAVWQFDATLIAIFGIACGFALWSRFAPNKSLKFAPFGRGTAQKRAAP